MDAHRNDPIDGQSPVELTDVWILIITAVLAATKEHIAPPDACVIFPLRH